MEPISENHFGDHSTSMSRHPKCFLELLLPFDTVNFDRRGDIMEDVAEQAVLRAIAAMRERLDEQLTVDDLARAAMFSKFHFTRLFQRLTGVSPGRFLSALRLQR